MQDICYTHENKLSTNTTKLLSLNELEYKYQKLPAAPTVAAPAPMNFAADSISRAAMFVPNSLAKKGLVTGTSCIVPA